MPAITHICPSHRPSQRDKYTIIIPAAGTGHRMKRYGPKSLTIVGNQTIIANQLTLIHRIFNYSEVIVVGGYQIEKLNKVVQNDNRVKVINNKDYEDTNVLHSINLALKKTKNSKVLVVYGDLYFNEVCIRQPFYKESGLVLCDTMKDEEIGCIVDNHTVKHTFYNLPTKWAQISYFTNNELEILRDVSSKNPAWFGFEAINHIINQGGEFKAFIPKQGKCFDIDTTYDLKHIKNENHY